jgi:hypothetical protein
MDDGERIRGKDFSESSGSSRRIFEFKIGMSEDAVKIGWDK